MNIKVVLHGSVVQIVPEIATVSRGTIITWQCMGVTTGQHEWAFTFKAGSPFRGVHTFIGASPTPPSQAPHRDRNRPIPPTAPAQYQVMVAAGPAVDPGDYKYDVGLKENGREIYDVDPRIVVL